MKPDKLRMTDKIEPKLRRKRKMESKIVLKGDVVIERRRNGKVLDRQELKNLIVNDGKERVAKLLNGVSATAFGYIAIGEGTNVPDAGDSVLQTEVERETAVKTYEADYKAVFEYTFVFGSGVTYDITEAGVFDAGASGTMLDRFKFDAKAVDSDTDLYIKVTINVA